MINSDTIKFLSLVNNIASLTKKGIKPFSECTIDNAEEFLFYDDETLIQGEDRKSYKVVKTILLVANRCYIVDYYEDFFELSEDSDDVVSVRAISYEDEERPSTIEVISNYETEDELYVLVKNGTWSLL